jgi:CRP/FNR family transcriptional regulator, cyclic AMP receptor protein
MSQKRLKSAGFCDFSSVTQGCDQAHGTECGIATHTTIEVHGPRMRAQRVPAVTRRYAVHDRGSVVLSPYGLDIIENCLTCKMRVDHIFCDLPAAALQSFENIKYATAYPKGAVLFVEGQSPRGIFVLCKGRVKLSICSTDGKTLILKIAEPGEVLGLSASVSGKPYELTAETVDPCQINFVKREDFQRFLRENSDACLRVAEQLSEKYNSACREIRSLGLSHSAAEKLAKLLLEWSAKNGEAAKAEPRLKLALTHEEIAQMIGTSRETVTRLFADLKKRQIVQSKGSTLLIRNKAALKAMAITQ